jgi:hypothetical protein
VIQLVVIFLIYIAAEKYTKPRHPPTRTEKGPGPNFGKTRKSAKTKEIIQNQVLIQF